MKAEYPDGEKTKGISTGSSKGWYTKDLFFLECWCDGFYGQTTFDRAAARKLQEELRLFCKGEE